MLNTMLPKSVRIRELGPREGFQTLPQTVPTAQKLELIDLLGKTGVRDIEITSFVRPDRVPQMADAEQVIKSFKRYPNIRYSALYLNPQGFDRARAIGGLDTEGWLYTAASETFLKKNNNTTIDGVTQSVPTWLKLFADAGIKPYGLMISTAFGCNYEGAIAHEKVVSILESIIKVIPEGQAPTEISLADTMGWATPDKLKRLVTLVRKHFPKQVVSLHLHDTRGTGMACVYAGLEEGIDIFDGSVGGMGGCPFAKGAAGNVATEDVAYLCEELGVNTGLNLEAYAAAATKAEEIVGAALPGKLYKTWKGGQKIRS
jgi:hydroxymethylglutaryl-CoA lyase